MKPSRLAVANGGSVISAILSFLPLTCCAFPSAFSFLAVGGLTSATLLMPYRWYFITLTFVFLSAGFYFAYWAPRQQQAGRITCVAPRRRTLQRTSLWAVTLVTIGILGFPYLLPYL
jgi:mercuric ion transport protein